MGHQRTFASVGCVLSKVECARLVAITGIRRIEDVAELAAHDERHAKAILERQNVCIEACGGGMLLVFPHPPPPPPPPSLVHYPVLPPRQP